MRLLLPNPSCCCHVKEFARIVEDDNQRIRQKLARAPADRAWRRRGWLAHCRSCPTSRAQLVPYEINNTRSATEAGAEASTGAAWDGMDGDLASLVGTLVGLEALPAGCVLPLGYVGYLSTKRHVLNITILCL